MNLTGLQSWPWRCCVLARANTKNLPWIAKAIAMVSRARESDRDYTRKAPSRIASAIAMQVANLLNSKCNTTCNLARARAMKLANLRKRARQTCRLAKASETNLPARKRDRNASCEHFCRSQTSWCNNPPKLAINFFNVHFNNYIICLVISNWFLSIELKIN